MDCSYGNHEREARYLSIEPRQTLTTSAALLCGPWVFLNQPLSRDFRGWPTRSSCTSRFWTCPWLNNHGIFEGDASAAEGDPDDIENEVGRLGQSALALRSSIGQIVGTRSLSSQISARLTSCRQT